MPIKPGDNKLGKRDTVTLAAYREQIDPEGKGVACARTEYGGWWKPICRVCGRSIAQGVQRAFIVKHGWSESDIRYVCDTCCAKAWEKRDVAAR